MSTTKFARASAKAPTADTAAVSAKVLHQVTLVQSDLQAAAQQMFTLTMRNILELSEQFDGVSGYEKSVKNLTWSYAASLSAVRAKTRNNVRG